MGKQSLQNSVLDFVRAKKKDESRRDAQEVADKLAREQREAMRDNANAAVESQYRDFKSTSEDLQGRLASLQASYKTFGDQLAKYNEAYQASEDEHQKHCAPTVDQHQGVEIDCEKRRQRESDRFLARLEHPDCTIGRTPGFDMVEEATISPALSCLADARITLGLSREEAPVLLIPPMRQKKARPALGGFL